MLEIHQYEFASFDIQTDRRHQVLHSLSTNAFH